MLQQPKGTGTVDEVCCGCGVALWAREWMYDCDVQLSVAGEDHADEIGFLDFRLNAMSLRSMRMLAAAA